MKNLPNVLRVFIMTFLSLAVASAILYFGFGIDLKGWWRLAIFVIMIGVPIYYYIKNRE